MSAWQGVAISLVVICDLLWSVAMIGGGVYLWLWKDQSGWMVFWGIVLASCWNAKKLIRYINGNYDGPKESA